MSNPAPALDEAAIKRVIEEVLARLGPAAAPAAHAAAPAPAKPRHGVYDCMKEACAAAHQGFLQLRAKGVSARLRVVELVKEMCTRHAAEWGKLEFEETKIGRLEHKVEKLQIVKLVPGVEWLRPDGWSGDHGIMLEEYTPFGVIGAVTPVTHSVPTISGNIISAVAAGNAIVFNPHPGGARCAAHAIRAYNEVIARELGIENLICTVAKPTLDTFGALCAAKEVGLLAVTGGPGVVSAAMKSGKRAVCAGPGNPPVVVDETVDLAKAAKDVITGAAYDNNLLCIGEKQVFVLDAVYPRFLEELSRAGAVKLNAGELEKLTAAAFTFKPDGGGCSHPVLNRDLVGADAAVLAAKAGRSVDARAPLLFAETDAGHPFVVEEQMMPMLPVVRVRTFEEAVARAKDSEHGYKHSAILHSMNVARMTHMARELDCTLFVKNGPSVSGLGLGGEGYLSYSIATTTGEGITTPATFTRKRRCVMVDQLRIY